MRRLVFPTSNVKIRGNIIDIPNRKIYFGELEILDGVIRSITAIEGEGPGYILPGFVDSHVHIESSMLIPSQFARLAVVHGTVATVSDPHEIANVLGVEGVKYMIANGNRVPFKFFFGAPSCVPATDFETSGATIGVEGVCELLEMPEIKYLAEMMNYPGVISGDSVVRAKLEEAKKLGKPIDGHAPGLRGTDIRKYIASGISTDHESFTCEEGREKLNLGMKIQIREGSAAKNFEALIGLLPEFPNRIMFCSDDKHPDDLMLGHINQLVARALGKGCDLFDVLQAACINPVEHYELEVGQLRVGDPADFVVSEEIKNFNSLTTYIDGVKVAEKGISLIPSVDAPVVNQFSIEPIDASAFQIPAGGTRIRVVKAVDGEIITRSFEASATLEGNFAISNMAEDILKFTVVNRYQKAPPALAFINGFGLKNGAMASCVGHDSHNIIAVGVDDASITEVVNAIVSRKGGIAAVSGSVLQTLALPVAGIMTNGDAYETAHRYAELDRFVKDELGSTLSAPFMTLSFMALLVIPSLKLGDRGLFDGEAFRFTDLFVKE